MILCGSVARIPQWSKFDKGWGKNLKKANMPVFHAKEFTSCPDHLKPERAALGNRLTTLVQKNVEFAFCTILQTQDFAWYRNGGQRLNTLLDSDYGLSFRFALSFLHRAIPKIIPEAKAVYLVVERGHKNVGAANDVLSRIRQELPDTLIQSPVTLVNKEDSYGTQASDLISYLILNIEERPGAPSYSDVPQDNILGVEIRAKPRIFRLPLLRPILEGLRDEVILSKPKYLAQFSDQLSDAGKASLQAKAS